MESDTSIVPRTVEALSPEFVQMAQENHAKLMWVNQRRNVLAYYQSEYLKRSKDLGLWILFVGEGESFNHYCSSPEICLKPDLRNRLLRVATAMEALGLSAKDMEHLAYTKFDRHVRKCIEMREIKTPEGPVWQVDNRDDVMDLIEQAKHLSWADTEMVANGYCEDRAREKGELTIAKKVDEGPAFSDTDLRKPCGFVVSAFATQRFHTVKLRIDNAALEGDGPYTIVIPGN